MISRRAVIAAAPLGLTARVGAAAAATLVLGACTAPPSLRIGYQRDGLLLAVKRRGDLEARLKGVAAVEWVEFPTAPPLLDAVDAGSIDLGPAGAVPAILAQAAGRKFVYVAAQPVSGASAAIVVRARSRLRDAGDLRGQRIACTAGSLAATVLTAALARARLEPGSVEVVDLTPTQAAEAFASGAADAWAVADPDLAAAEADHDARILVAGAGLAPGASFLVAGRGLAGERAAVLRQTLDGLGTAATWAAGHRAALAELIASALAIDPALAGRIAARQDVGVVPLTATIVAAQQASADALHARGAIPKVAVAGAVWPGWSRKA